MLERQFTHRVLSPDEVPPSDDRLRVVGAFNPGAAAVGDQVVLIVRVVEQVIASSPGLFPSPRFDSNHGLQIDWLNESDISLADPRVYENKHDGSLRLRFISHLRVYRSKDGKTIDPDADVIAIMPQGDYEIYGIEDPRITRIGDTYYITYVAVSHHGVCTCLMSTRDFRGFERHGVIFCPDNKDVVLFPEKIGGDYVAMHRPMPAMKFSLPQIWLAHSPDLIRWGGHELLLAAGADATSDRIGGGTPPIKTDRGWLTLYHGSDKKPGQKGVGAYTAGALLLDLHNPTRITARTPHPIMAPEADFEKHGFVPNIIFPTAVLDRDTLYYVYYGAADESTGVVGYDKEALLDTLMAREASMK